MVKRDFERLIHKDCGEGNGGAVSFFPCPELAERAFSAIFEKLITLHS